MVNSASDAGKSEYAIRKKMIGDGIIYRALLVNPNWDYLSTVQISHQYIISEGTTLTVYNDGTVKNNQNQNICLAFTVDDIENEYRKVQALGVRIIEPPTKRPWGAVNMSFYDPDNNVIYFRQFQEEGV